MKYYIFSLLTFFIISCDKNEVANPEIIEAKTSDINDEKKSDIVLIWIPISNFDEKMETPEEVEKHKNLYQLVLDLENIGVNLNDSEFVHKILYYRVKNEELNKINTFFREHPQLYIQNVDFLSEEYKQQMDK